MRPTIGAAIAPAVIDGTGFPWSVLAGVLSTGLLVGGLVYEVRKHRGEASASAAPNLIAGVGAVATWEAGWWLWRRHRRAATYALALNESRRVGKPLVVIGAPDSGPTSGYACGDVTVDASPTACTPAVQADITKDKLPFADNSVVVFCSCVLEYVNDAKAAVDEIWRVSGGDAFFVGVEPWTLTGHLFPGAKRTLPAALR